MAFDIESAFDAVKGLISSIDGMLLVKEGVPEAFGPSVSAFIAMAPISFRDIATGLLEIEVTFYVLFGYKVSGAEADAERKLMRGIADLIPKFVAARLNDFGDTLVSATINLELAAQPEYEIFAAQEYRRYPVLIRGCIQSTF
jgi:hypothetical protein